MYVIYSEKLDLCLVFDVSMVEVALSVTQWAKSPKNQSVGVYL